MCLCGCSVFFFSWSVVFFLDSVVCVVRCVPRVVCFLSCEVFCVFLGFLGVFFIGLFCLVFVVGWGVRGVFCFLIEVCFFYVLFGLGLVLLVLFIGVWGVWAF